MNCLKKGAWTVCRFKRVLDKKEGMIVLREGWDTNAHYVLEESSY